MNHSFNSNGQMPYNSNSNNNNTNNNRNNNNNNSNNNNSNMNQNNNNNNNNNNNTSTYDLEINKFIAACNSLNSNNNSRINGESYLLSLKNNSHKPYAFCFAILNKCQSLSESHIQFHALSHIRDSFLNEWYLLSPNYIESLRNKLLLYPINNKLNGYVLNQITKCVSIMYKRTMTTTTHNDNVYNHILSHIQKYLLLSNGNPWIILIGLTFCNELICEFSINHSSSIHAMGLNWNFHIKSHRGFEDNVLYNMFDIIIKLFKNIMNDIITINNNNEYKINAQSNILNSISNNNQSVFEMINMIAIVIEKCLSFNFNEKISNDQLLLIFVRNLSANNYENELCLPGRKYYQILINNDLLLLLNLFHIVLYQNNNKLFNTTTRILRESIINMYSLNGEIFNDNKIDADDDGDDNDPPRNRVIRFKIDPSHNNRKLRGMRLIQNRLPYLKKCLTYFNQYIWPLISQQINNYKNNNSNNIDNELILDICRMINKLCINFRLELLTEISEFCLNKYYFFGSIRDLMELLIYFIPSDVNNIDTWSNEGFDILIQSIISIISCYEIRKNIFKKQSAKIIKIFEFMTQSVFVKFVEKMLNNAEIEIKQKSNNNNNNTTSVPCNDDNMGDQFVDQEYLSERLVGLAIIARINALNSLPYLVSKIQDIIAKIKKFKINLIKYMNNNNNNAVVPSSNMIELHIYHEKLYWLFQFLGYTLSDDCSFEVPVIPNILITNNNINNGDILTKSIYPLFEWIEFENECINNNLYQLISPLLGETVIKMLSRWSNSYLMPKVANYCTMIPVNLLKSFGNGYSSAKKTLNMIIYKCYINIFKWGTLASTDLISETMNLLLSFIKHSSIRSNLCESSSYNQYILQNYYNNKLNLYKLPNNIISSFIRVISQSLLCSNASTSNVGGFNKISSLIYNEFISSYKPFYNKKQKSFFNTESLNKLELSIIKLSGIAACCSDLIFKYFRNNKILEILIEIIPQFSNEFNVQHVLIIFNIFVDIAENDILYLDKNESTYFLNLCVNLIEKFEIHNKMRMKQINSKYLDCSAIEAYSDMQINEIMSILKLLEFMATNNQQISSNNLICGQSIFKSFYYLSPAINNNIFSLSPKLCLKFYEVFKISIISFISVFGDSLNNIQRSTILNNKLKISLNNCNNYIIEYGLDIIESFADYHLINSGSPFLNILSDLLQQLFQLLINVATPKIIYNKLCNTIFLILICLNQSLLINYFQNFINNNCKNNKNNNNQSQKKELQNKFQILINKINNIKNNKNIKYPLNTKIKNEFQRYLLTLMHEIRAIVTIH